MLMYPLRHALYLMVVAIAALYADAGYIRIAFKKREQTILSEPIAHVLPQIGTMATRAMMRTIGDIQRQRRFVRHLLKHYVVISY